MTVFEYDGKLLIVDCGVLFPDVDQPGVDLILPDFAPILDRLGRRPGDRAHPRPRGPHRRGAVPARPQAGHPAGRLAVHAGAGRGEAGRAADRAVHADRRARGSASGSGRSSCEFFAVNHSIPDALAVAIRTPAGLVLHTGDFKMDQLPLDGRITDLAGFARLGAEGVDLLLSDSTNAEIPGFVTPEREIGPVLDSIFAKAPRPDHRGRRSPRTCTGCSRCSTRRTSTAARSP